MIVDRMYVIQHFIDAVKAGSYLEIGVHAGECFLRIKCRRKIAVDPQLKIPSAKKRKYCYRNYRNLFNRYCEMASDDFFQRHRDLLLLRRPQVVFIDGLHTYEQSLKDVQNALDYLPDSGIIIMHDCNPLSEAAAFPARSCDEAKRLNIPGFTGEWNGDVWKTIVDLRSSRSDLRVSVLDCDQGLGIITKGDPESVLPYDRKEILSLSYQDLERDRQALLNLKTTDFLPAMLEAAARRVA